MNIFCEALCKHLESRISTRFDEKRIHVCSRLLTADDFCEDLNLSQFFLRGKTSKWQKPYRRYRRTEFFMFVFLIVLMLLTAYALDTELTPVLIVVLITYFCFNTFNKQLMRSDWISSLELKLRLLEWKIPPPEKTLSNPRCVFVPFTEYVAWQEWLAKTILPKLKEDLGIGDIEELKSLLKRVQYSSNDIRKYSLLTNVALASSGSRMYLCFFEIICPLLLLIGGVSTLVSFLCLVAFVKIFYEVSKSPNEFVVCDVETNEQLLDIMCRLHRVKFNESIVFAAVTEYTLFKNNYLSDLLAEHTAYKEHFKCEIYHIDSISNLYKNMVLSLSRSPEFFFHIDGIQYLVGSNVHKDLDKYDILLRAALQSVNVNLFEMTEDSRDKFDFILSFLKVNKVRGNLFSVWMMLTCVIDDLEIRYGNELFVKLHYEDTNDKWTVEYSKTYRRADKLGLGEYELRFSLWNMKPIFHVRLITPVQLQTSTVAVPGNPRWQGFLDADT